MHDLKYLECGCLVEVINDVTRNFINKCDKHHDEWMAYLSEKYKDGPRGDEEWQKDRLTKSGEK